MTDAPFSSSRRDLMKAIGAGTALTALGGSTVVGATQAEDGTVADTQEQDDDQGDDGSGATVHVVQTLVGPPTNPERPADFFYQPTGLHVQPGDVVKFVFVTPDHNVVSYHPAFGMRRRMPTGLDPISAPVSGFRPSSIPGDMIDPPAPPGMGEGGNAGGGGDDTGGGDDDTGGGGGSENGDGGSGPTPVPDTFLLGLETPGVYDLFCSPHESFGMAMRVVVGDETETHFETSNPANLPEPRTGPVGLARVTLTDAALQPANIVEQGTVSWQDLEATQSGGGGTGNGGTGSGGGGDDDGDDNGDDDGDDNGDDDSQGGDG